MSDHTPTPWVAQAATAGTHISRKDYGNDDDLIAYLKVSFHPTMRPEEQAANAAFIVKAVNHHDELVAALKACYHRIVRGDQQSVSEMIRAQSVLDKLETK